MKERFGNNGIKKYNVWIYNPNTHEFESYDIMKYLMDRWNKLPNSERMSFTMFSELKEWILEQIKYRFWSRTEYEIIFREWPCCREEYDKKIDIYDQCEMNADAITHLFKDNIRM